MYGRVDRKHDAKGDQSDNRNRFGIEAPPQRQCNGRRKAQL
jgi:hypothetical protein